MGWFDWILGGPGKEALEKMHEESARIKARLERIDAATELKDWGTVDQELREWAEEIKSSKED